MSFGPNYTPEVAIAADDQNLCGECPVWNPEDGTLEWTDCVGNKFFRWDWSSRRHAIIKQNLTIYGFRRNRQGGYIITNPDGIWHWQGDGVVALIAGQADGYKCQVNDCIADARGRLLTGSFFYNPAAEYELGKLIRVDTDGRTTIIDEGFQLANGLGFSPAGEVLYFADTVGRRIYAYDYVLSTGTVRNRRLLVQVPNDEGLPDGLAVDAAGFIWSAQWYGSCIVRYDPDGKVERRVAMPAKQISSLAFGGPDLTDIFITSAGQSEAMPVMPPGYDPNTGNFGGPLYRVNLGIAGLRSHQADITPTRSIP